MAHSWPDWPLAFQPISSGKIFENNFKNCFGNAVWLSAESLAHLSEHPEMLGIEQEIIADIDKYKKDGRPTCPQGGTYTYGNVDEPPRCTIKDHALPP